MQSETRRDVLFENSRHVVVLRVNLSLREEPVEWFQRWKARGIVDSVKDAVLMAFQALNEKITEQDLKRAQLRTLTRDGE